MTEIKPIGTVSGVSGAAAVTSAGKVENSDVNIDFTSPKKELTPEQIKAKAKMESKIADALGFKKVLGSSYIVPELKNEKGKWVVVLTKTENPGRFASLTVADYATKKYEIYHITGQLGVDLKDVQNVEYATARRTARGDASIEVGRSVKIDLDKIGKKFTDKSLYWHRDIKPMAQETNAILSN